MTQSDLIARLRTTWDDLSLIGWGNDARNVEEAIERLSPPLDGEGVIQADIDRAVDEADRIFMANSDVLCEADVRAIERNLAQAFAAHRRAATLTPREQRMEKALRGIRQLVGCDDGDKAESIVAICDAALSLQDKT